MIPPRRKRSRPVFIALGIVGALVLCCCGGIGGLAALGYRRGARDDRDAKIFARSALFDMGRHWDLDTARPYLSPVWSLSADREGRLFKECAQKLGPLKALGEFTTSSFHYGRRAGLRPGAHFTMSAPATFAKRKGTIRLGLAKIGGRWGIENLRIDSPLFSDTKF